MCARVNAIMLVPQGDTGNAQVDGASLHGGEIRGDAARIVELMSSESTNLCNLLMSHMFSIGVGLCFFWCCTTRLLTRDCCVWGVLLLFLQAPHLRVKWRTSCTKCRIWTRKWCVLSFFFNHAFKFVSYLFRCD